MQDKLKTWNEQSNSQNLQISTDKFAYRNVLAQDNDILTKYCPMSSTPIVYPSNNINQIDDDKMSNMSSSKRQRLSSTRNQYQSSHYELYKQESINEQEKFGNSQRKQTLRRQFSGDQTNKFQNRLATKIIEGTLLKHHISNINPSNYNQPTASLNQSLESIEGIPPLTYKQMSVPMMNEQQYESAMRMSRPPGSIMRPSHLSQQNDQDRFNARDQYTPSYISPYQSPMVSISQFDGSISRLDSIKKAQSKGVSDFKINPLANFMNQNSHHLSLSAQVQNQSDEEYMYENSDDENDQKYLQVDNQNRKSNILRLETARTVQNRATQPNYNNSNFSQTYDQPQLKDNLKRNQTQKGAQKYIDSVIINGMNVPIKDYQLSSSSDSSSGDSYMNESESFDSSSQDSSKLDEDLVTPGHHFAKQRKAMKINEVEAAKRFILTSAPFMQIGGAGGGARMSRTKTNKTTKDQDIGLSNSSYSDEDDSFKSEIDSQDLQRMDGENLSNSNVVRQSSIKSPFPSNKKRGTLHFQRQNIHVVKQKSRKDPKIKRNGGDLRKKEKRVSGDKNKKRGTLKRSKALYYSGEDNNSNIYEIEDEYSHNSLQRLRLTMNLNKFIILPDDPFRERWELFITLILLFTSIITPFRIAFYQVDNNKWTSIDYAIDIIFLIDIFITFFSAYYNENDELIHDRKIIALGYVKSWFLVDISSCIPFSLMFSTHNYQSLIRISRLPKLYRLIKLTKLTRLLKVVKERNTLVKYLNDVLKLGLGFERLAFYILLFVVCVHIVSCFWIIVASYESFGPETWVAREGLLDKSNSDQYLAALYYTIVIVTTVGYGDITVTTQSEQLFCMLILLIGDISFSFAIGSLSSVLSSMDAKAAKLKSKLQVLSEIQQEYNLPYDLFRRLRLALKYDHSKNSADQIQLLTELPQNLRVELSVIMHQELIKTVKFFRKKSPHFIAFAGPLLKPIKVEKNQFIYQEGDPIDEIYFLVSGQAGYVLKEFNDAVYVIIDKSYYFGEIDFIYMDENGENDAKRKFSAKAIEDCDLLVLSKEDLLLADQEFEDVISNLFKNAMQRLKRTMKIKRKSRNFYQTLQQNQHVDAKFTARLTKPSLTKYDLIGKSTTYIQNQQQLPIQPANTMMLNMEQIDDENMDEGIQTDSDMENEGGTGGSAIQMGLGSILPTANDKSISNDNFGTPRENKKQMVSAFSQDQNFQDVVKRKMYKSESAEYFQQQNQNNDSQKFFGQQNQELIQDVFKTQILDKKISYVSNSQDRDDLTNGVVRRQSSIGDFERYISQNLIEQNSMLAQHDSQTNQDNTLRTNNNNKQDSTQNIGLRKQKTAINTPRDSSSFSTSQQKALNIIQQKITKGIVAQETIVSEEQDDNMGGNRWKFLKKALNKKNQVLKQSAPQYVPGQFQKHDTGITIHNNLNTQLQQVEEENLQMYTQLDERMARFEGTLDKINQMIASLMASQSNHSNSAINLEQSRDNVQNNLAQSYSNESLQGANNRGISIQDQEMFNQLIRQAFSQPNNILRVNQSGAQPNNPTNNIHHSQDNENRD